MHSAWIKIIQFLTLIILSAPVYAEQNQSTDTVIMISPDYFQYNVETAKTNRFQQTPSNVSNLTQFAMHEFLQMVDVLKKNNIKVITLPSRLSVETPDAVFPNNWFSIHQTRDGKVVMVLYPMLVKNRRAERQTDNIKAALRKQNVLISKVIDLTHFETQNLALEGTGSLILDRINHVAFVSLSPRGDKKVLDEFVKKMHYRPVIFHSYDDKHTLIYHTNVMMSIGSHFAVLTAESIVDTTERSNVIAELISLGKDIIYVTPQQMKKMAANILEVRSKDGKTKIVLSKSAYNAYTPRQRQQLKRYGDLVIVDIEWIEKIGGGSARCMLAEVFHI